MTNRLLVDLRPDGRVSVSTFFDGEIAPSPVGEPFELAWPLDPDAMENLRWYLEDYLRAPFEVYGERASRVAGRLTGWGQAMFEAIFGAGPARDAYETNWRSGSFSRPWITVITGQGHGGAQIWQPPLGCIWCSSSNPRMMSTRSGISLRAVSAFWSVQSWQVPASYSASSRWR